MSLNVGSLHASLTASTAGWHKAMAGALKSAEALAKNVKRLSGEMATGAAAMSALGGAALHLASAVDGPTKRAMEGLHKSSQLLAVQVADMLLPAVKSLSDTLRTAAAYVAGLNPEVKAAVATFATWAVGLAVVGKSLAVVAGLAGNVFGILRAGVGALAAIGTGPLLGIVAGVGLAIGAVLLLHRAWRKNWGGIQEVTEQVVNGLREGFAAFANFMGSVWNHIVESAQRYVELLLKVGDALERITGKNLGIGGLREGFKGLFADLKSGEFLSQAFSFGKSVGASIVDGVKEEWAAIKSELGLGDMFNKGTPIALGRGMGPDIGKPDTSSAPVMSFVATLQAQANAASSATAAIAESFSAAEGKAVAVEWAASQWAASAIAAAKSARSFRDTMKTIGHTLLNASGALGQTINNIGNAASQGGPWAALLAAVMEVFQRMESFKRLLGFFEQGLVRLGQFMEPLVGPLFELIGNSMAYATEGLAPLFKALQPLFESFAKVAVKLMQPIMFINNILSALGPVFEMLGPMLDKFFDFLGPLFDLGSLTLRVFATALLSFLAGLNTIAGALGDQKAAAEALRLRGLIASMWVGTDERIAADSAAAGASWDVAIANTEVAKAARDLAESLSNVPSGYRLAMARYEADNAGFNAGKLAGRDARLGGLVINGDVNVTTTAETAELLADDFMAEARRRRGSKRGNPVGGP